MQVLRRSLPFHGRIGCQDDFLHASTLDAFEQWLDLQVIRADAFYGRENPLQDVVLSFVSAYAFQRQQIQRLLDHADNRPIPLTALAYLAAFAPGGGDIEALLAKGKLGLEVGQRFSQLAGDLLRGTQEEECQPGGRLRADAGETFQGNNKF